MISPQATSSSERPIHAVVFDLGGVVVRICRSIHEAAARVGLDVPEDELAPEKRAARKAVHALYEAGRISCDEFFAQLSASTRGRITPVQFRLLHENWLIDDYPGVSNLIDALHHRGIATGVLSNTNRIHWAQMMTTADQASPSSPPRFHAPLMPQFRHASHLLGLAKPDPAIYRTFIQLTGFDPARTVFFDDLEPNVHAARDAGWQAVQIDHTGDPARQMGRWLTDQGVIGS